MNKVVNLKNWCIIVNMSAGGDYLALTGAAWGHHRVRNGKFIIPGTFVSFDRDTMIGVSMSGTCWQMNPETFRANGNARTLEDAIQFIEKHWVLN